MKCYNSCWWVLVVAIASAHHCHEDIGFEHVGDRCYFFSTKQATWYEAQRHCAWLGARLVSIESKNESDALSEHIQKLHPDSDATYWTSGISLTNGKVDEWLWSGTGYGINSAEFTNWCTGQPSSQHEDGEHCMQIVSYTETHNDCWNDKNCFSTQCVTCGRNGGLFICEED